MAAVFGMSFPLNMFLAKLHSEAPSGRGGRGGRWAVSEKGAVSLEGLLGPNQEPGAGCWALLGGGRVLGAGC